MLSGIHQFLFYLHVACGSIGLLVFWLPMFSKKGSPFHKTFGKVFSYGMFAVAISGIVMSVMVLIDPIAIRTPDSELSEQAIQQFSERARRTSAFLLMLSLLVFTNVKHSLLVLKAKQDRAILRSVSHIASISLLSLTGIAIGYFGFTSGNTLFIVFSILSIVSSGNLFFYVFKKSIKEREWLIEHLGNIIGAGIGAYTAFFAFGGRRFLAEIFSGQLQVVPWILPGVIGGMGIAYLSKKYRVQYRVV